MSASAFAFFVSDPGNPLSSFVLYAAPNTAVIVATLGFCLIVVELNRPGLILPGFAGLALTLLSLAALARYPLRPSALFLLGCACGTLACNLWKQLPTAFLVLASLGIPLGLWMLVPGTAHHGVTLSIAAVCGTAIAVTAALLSRVAFRARRLKAVH